MVILPFLFYYGIGNSNAQVLDTQAVFNKVVLAHEIQGSFPDSAYKLAQEVEEISLQHNYKEGLAYAYMRMGYLDNIQGNNNLAKMHLRLVLQIRKELQAYEGAAYACITLSYIYHELGIPDSAFLVMYDALKFQEKTTNQSLLGSIHLQLGYLGSLYQHEESETIGHFEKAQEIAKNQNDTTALIELYNQWGTFYSDRDLFDEALSYNLQVATLLQNSSDSLDLINNYNNIAVCYVELGAMKVAKEYYQKVLRISQSLYLPAQEGLAYVNLGVFHARKMDNDSSLFYFLKALDIYLLVDDKAEIARIYERLASIYARTKNYEEALDYHIKYTNLNEEIINQERIHSISEMQVKYNTEQKELALKLSQEEQKTQKAQKNVFIGGTVVLALLLIIGAMVYLQKQRVNKKNRLLQQQKMKGLLDDQELKTYQAMMQGQEEERLRISADLHDRLGSMLSTVKLLFSGLEDKLDKQQEANQKQYNKAKYIIDDACTEIRRISHNLGAGMVANFGLADAIHELSDSINQSDSIKCEFSHFNMPNNIPLKVETELYRIVQESFNNVIKHAQASQISIQLNGLETEINLIIEDNGMGFDATDSKVAKGLGLKSIQNRVSLLGGTYHLDTLKGRGTTFIIDIPINWNNDEDLHRG